MYKKFLSSLLSGLLFVQQPGFCQLSGPPVVPAALSTPAFHERFRPQHLRALEVDAQKGDFNVVLDRGDAGAVCFEPPGQVVRQLMCYFQDALRLPASAFWVNLRPDGEDEIIDPLLEQTDIGRIMLEADLQLKKDLALMTDPDTAEGREYWDKLYAKAEVLFGPLEDMEIPTLARPWIVPGEIILAENGRSAYIFKATLKVMLEQDYLRRQAFPNGDPRLNVLNEYAAQLIRSRILPALTRRVNAGRAYAPLRQVYYSLILAEWYKERFQQGKTADNLGVQGVIPSGPWSKLTYFNAYKKSFEQGEYRKEKTVASAGQMVIRQYASGGLSLGLGERGNLGSLNLGEGLAVVKQAWRSISAFVEVRLPDALGRRPQPPQKVMEELRSSSAKLNLRLKEYASFNRSATDRTFKDYSSEELSGIWSDYKEYILKHVEAGVMPVLEDFRPFPSLEQFNLRFSKNDLSWYGRETSLTNVPLLILFDSVKKIAYSVPLNTMALTEKEVFNYDLTDLLEMVNNIPADERARLQLRVGWGTNGGLRGFYLLEGDSLVEFKGYTLNRIKTDEVYRTDDPAMALTKDLGELEARCLRGLGFMDAECSKPFGTHQMVIQEAGNGEITKEFSLVQLRREGKLGRFGSALGRMLTLEGIVEESGVDDQLAQTQYYKSGKNFGAQLRALHEKLWFNGFAADGRYYASWHHAANIDYQGNVVDLIPYSFKSIAGEEFNPFNPSHKLMVEAWVALDLERFFIGAPPMDDWNDWGFIGNTNNALLKKVFLQGFIRGYLPDFNDFDPEERDLRLAESGRLDPLVSIFDRMFVQRKMAIGQQEYDLHERIADAFIESFIAEQKDMRRYGEAPRPGLSADNIPPNAGASSIRRDNGSRDGGSAEARRGAEPIRAGGSAEARRGAEPIRDGGSDLKEAFLMLYPEDAQAAQAVLKGKTNELARLSRHAMCKNADLQQRGIFVQFMIFGERPEFARSDSMKDRLDGMIADMSAVARALSAEEIVLDDTGEQLLRQRLSRNFETVVGFKTVDYRRFFATYAMAAALISASLKSGAWKREGPPDRCNWFIDLVEQSAARNSRAKLASFADFIDKEHDSLFDLAETIDGFGSREGFSSQLLRRQDRKFIDLFDELRDLREEARGDEKGGLHPDLNAAIDELLGLAHTNKRYRLKRKALEFILRLQQIESLPGAIDRADSSVMRRIADAVHSYAGQETDGMSAEKLLGVLREEFMNAAHKALFSHVLQDLRGRVPEIGDLDWADEHTLDQLAFVVGVYANARQAERFSVTGMASEVLARFVTLRSRDKLNAWLNQDFKRNKDDRIALEAAGYNTDFFNRGYNREYTAAGLRYRISVDFDFFNQAAAGEDIPSCFNPLDQDAGHMPLYHALEVTSTFLSVSDKEGRRLADAVVLLSPQGLLVQKLYSRRNIDLDRQVFDFLVNMVKDGMVPAVFWQSESPGLETAIKSGIGGRTDFVVEKTLFMDEKDVYFDDVRYESSIAAKFPCRYGVSRKDAEDYRASPDVTGISTQEEAASIVPKRRIDKEDRRFITQELFSLGMTHVDLEPILSTMETIIIDDPQGVYLEKLIAELAPRNVGAPVSMQDRAGIRAAVENIKSRFSSLREDEADIRGLIAALESSASEIEYQKAQYALVEKGSAAVGPLLERLNEALAGKDFIGSPKIVEVLGQIPDKRTIPALIAALDDVNLPVRKQAVIACGRLQAQEALERLCELAKYDEYIAKDAVDAIKTIFRVQEDFDLAFSRLKDLSAEYDLPFEVFAQFMETFLFDRPERLSGEDMSWISENTAIPLERLGSVVYFHKAADMVDVLSSDGTIEVAYSGDRIWLALYVAGLLSRRIDERDVVRDLEEKAGLMQQARMFVPSIGAELEVHGDLISDSGFDPQRARAICSWLGIDWAPEGKIEYSVNPTSTFIEQVEIKDFLLECGLIPAGYFPLHVNVAVPGKRVETESEAEMIGRYIALPLSLLYAPDRRFRQDSATGNFYGAIAGIKEVAEGHPGLKRAEFRPLALVRSGDQQDYRGMVVTEPGTYADTLRAAEYLVAAWTAYSKDPGLRSTLDDLLAGEFMLYTQAVEKVYAHQEHGLLRAFAANLSEQDDSAGESIVRVRSFYPAVQEDIFQAVSKAVFSVEEILRKNGLFLAALSAGIPSQSAPISVLTVVRPEYTTAAEHDILDKAERTVADLLVSHPSIFEEALKSLGKEFPAGNAIESIELRYHGSGYFKCVFKVTLRSKELTRELLLELKRDARSLNGLFEKGELEMWSQLQGLGLVPQLGVLTKTSAATVSAAAQDGNPVAMVEFIDGENIAELTGKEMFDYDPDYEAFGQKMTEEMSRACLSTLVGVFLQLNRDVLRQTSDFAKAQCRGPYDFYQKNLVVEKNTGRAVLVDIGMQRDFTGIYDYLALAIAFYLDYDEKRPHDSARALGVLSEKWPDIDWDAILTGVVQTLENRKKQNIAQAIPYLHIADIFTEEKDVDAVIGLINVFLEGSKSGSAAAHSGAEPISSTGGIDLRSVALAGGPSGKVYVPVEEKAMAHLLLQLRQDEMEGTDTGRDMQEKLISCYY